MMPTSLYLIACKSQAVDLDNHQNYAENATTLMVVIISVQRLMDVEIIMTLVILSVEVVSQKEINQIVMI